MDEPLDYNTLSPGIRELVRDLHAHGFVTTDSGDGSNHAAGMEGAMPYRHVVVQTTDVEMEAETRRLAALYPTARVELTWTPGEPALILLMPDGQEG